MQDSISPTFKIGDASDRVDKKGDNVNNHFRSGDTVRLVISMDTGLDDARKNSDIKVK